MGYRVRLGKVPKEYKEKFAECKTEEQAQALANSLSDTRQSLYAPFFHTELHELGKYIDHKTPGEYEPFYNFELEEEEFYVLTKDGLIAIINGYREIVLSIYKNDLESLNTLSNLAELQGNLERKVREWDIQFDWCPITGMFDKESNDITRSWMFEYAIFNLLHIYRTFDWENDYLIYSGW